MIAACYGTQQIAIYCLVKNKDLAVYGFPGINVFYFVLPKGGGNGKRQHDDEEIAQEGYRSNDSYQAADATPTGQLGQQICAGQGLESPAQMVRGFLFGGAKRDELLTGTPDHSTVPVLGCPLSRCQGIVRILALIRII
jgi:hypothetical protein